METRTIRALTPISALRDSFGDSKPPEITRKITACVACRKQKIKCHMTGNQPPCSRCKKRGLPCTVNRSLQMILENDVSWKHTVTKKLRRLEVIIEKLADVLNMPELRNIAEDDGDLCPPQAQFTQATSRDGTNEVSAAGEREQLWEVTVDPHCEPASIPASCISEVRSPGTPDSAGTARPTLIAKGIISLEEASGLFERYRDRLDHLLYRILGEHTSLESVMASSSLLTAAICTVAALHSNSLGHLYDRCFRELRHVVSADVFSRQHNMDDVRGLCIGAFWLNGLSWALVGAAVRIASEIDLHHAIYKALDGDRSSYMKTRLYYLLFVCDHHSSVLYGRPPMTRECDSIKAAMRFLESDHATEDDVRLVTQVKIWSISAQVFDSFGMNVSKALSPTQLPQLRRFSISFDTWYADWSDRFGPNEKVGLYPPKGVGLHFNFAKLYLCSHAFRGVRDAPSRKLSPELAEVANTAILCASSILGVMTSDEEMQSYLNGLPLCFDIMIAFSVVFLLKVVTKYPEIIWIDQGRIFDLATQTVEMLKRVSHAMHEKHLLVSIASGLEKLVQKLQDTTSETTPLRRPVPPVVAEDQLAPVQDDIDWVRDISNFDFFNLQTPTPDLDSWPLDLDIHHQGAR